MTNLFTNEHLDKHKVVIFSAESSFTNALVTDGPYLVFRGVRSAQDSMGPLWRGLDYSGCDFPRTLTPWIWASAFSPGPGAFCALSPLALRQGICFNVKTPLIQLY